MKHIGDHEVPIRFIFSGIGSSLADLYHGHESAYRYTSSICLERLTISDCMGILETAAQNTDIEIGRGYKIRAAQISDGFPHYVHLLGTKIFIEAYKNRESDTGIQKVSSNDFEVGVQKTINDIEQKLKTDYDNAVRKYSGNDYVYILWAIADSPELQRQVKDIYASYVKIAQKKEQEPLRMELFRNRLYSLKDERHGEAIVSLSRAGWYAFREPILRGYCRLQAAKEDISLGPEYF